ncbi:HesB/YadR/YfhF family protein [Pseudalkalibacillus berkeleyi]|uniref:HesB/YadR/YfhF family protein n=1 Tax=Pseudalkalibacillus berkeleyi TaxID=1069813 RepID=A0ABS9GZK2_9BACL|nr:HesB/YadR/YfhF family protein [Pseudalkalibacillus berkeleyi]MCF6137251.1 HesB/YadR/YfhF family protein [Pseudalkalibacillus berkeleyi]
MEFTITKPAVQWFITELDLNEGDHVRLFARLGGCSTVQSGYSIGISKETPFEPAESYESDGITFFIEEKDAWYFRDHDLKIKYSRKYDEISYEYTEQQ